MSIALPAGLPARRTLLAEGVEVLDPDQLQSWGRRPLRVCLVNLMPNKPATETQIARLLGATSIPVALTLCLPDSYRPKSTPADHLAFYRPWTSIRHERFDALIVTGAPVEALPFEEVVYWPGLCAVFDWARSHAIASLYICWAAQAALYHFHRVPKHRLPQKMFGVFQQRVSGGGSCLLRGFGEAFPVPVSRHTEVHAGELPIGAGLTVLAALSDAGPCLMEDRGSRAVYMFNHLEYDTETLRDEFLRDRQAGKPVEIPRNYFPDDDPQRVPANTWRPYGHLLIANWLGEIYRTARPRVTDEPVIQWALADPRAAYANGTDRADLLIAGAGRQDVLPSVLRVLADGGLAPRAVKVHQWPGSGQLIEFRMERLDQRTIERAARRLSALPTVSRVAFRIGGGAGGWLVGRHATATPQSNAPGRSSAPSEAA